MRILSVPRRSRQAEDGMAVIVVIALFAIMLMFLGISLGSLNHLRMDLRLIERKQLQRIQQPYVVTNSLVRTNGALSATVLNSWTASLPSENR